MLLHKFRFPPLTYLYSSIVVFSGLNYLLFCKRKTTYQLTSSDFFLIGFILWGLFSFTWASNQTLVLLPFFAFVQLFLVKIFFGSLWKLYIFRRLCYGLLITVNLIGVVQFLSFVFFKNTITGDAWHYFFGFNENYVSTYLIACTLPLLIYAKQHNKILLQFILCFYISLILYFSTSLGALIAFLGVLYFLFRGSLVKYELYLIGLLTLLLVYVSFNLELLEMYGIESYSRIYMIKSSFWLFLEHPLQGIGLGNWKIEAYKYLSSETLNSFYRLDGLGNHNIYSMLLAETGLIGVLLASFIVLPIILYRRKPYTLYEKSALAVLLFHFISSFFYQAVWHYEINYSKLQVLSFCALGILSINNSYKIKISSFRIIPFLWVVSLISVLYYYNFYKSSLVCGELSKEKSEENILEFEKLYSKYLFNSCYGQPNILYDLGSHYRLQSDTLLAKKYYEEAVITNPFDHDRNCMISEFYFYAINDIEKSKKFSEQVIRYEESSRVNLLNISIDIATENYDNAIFKLALPSDKHKFYADLLYQKIYESNYANKLLDNILEDSLLLMLPLNKSSALYNLDKQFTNVILNHGLNSREARLFRKALNKYVKSYEKDLHSLCSDLSFSRYLGQRYARNINFEVQRIAKFNRLDSKDTKNLKIIIEEYIFKCKTDLDGVGTNDQLRVWYSKSLAGIGVIKGIDYSFLNY